MSTNLKENIELSLSRSACLVLFEFLTQSYENWRKTNPNDDTASPMLLHAETRAQRVALWKLEGSLERTLPELFSSNYEELLAESSRILIVGD